MAWITPKTDWNGNDKYNFGDLNRVDNNTRFLNTFISGFNNAATLETYTSQAMTNYPRAALLNLTERNLKALRDTFIPYVSLTCKTDWIGGKDDVSFDYNHANRLELNLATMKTMAENILAEFEYCGSITAGQDFNLGG